MMTTRGDYPTPNPIRHYFTHGINTHGKPAPCHPRCGSSACAAGWCMARIHEGLILSVASMVGLVGGIWAASHFSAWWRSTPHVTWSVNSLHMALALTFLLVVVTVHLLAKLLEKMLDLVALGLVNKLAGALFGLLNSHSSCHLG